MLISGVDPNDLSQAGWGVIFAHDEPAAVRDALRLLLDRRMHQSGDLYRELDYFALESVSRFRERYGVSPGPVDPGRLPYYLLLVGSPEAIPFYFQSQLSIQHAVGRLHFERPSDYANYARTVVAAESSDSRPRRAVFAAVQNPADSTTRSVARQLVEPLVASLTHSFPEWPIEFHTGQRTSKSELRRLFNGNEGPRLLFVSAHGYRFSPGHQRQRDFQGSLVCQDWPGPRAKEPVKESAVLTADDIDADSSLAGSVIFLLASNSAGTPEIDDFSTMRDPGAKPQALAPRPFVNRLAQRLLGHENGGALAIVGHVDRVWTLSLRSVQEDMGDKTFQAVFERLFRGDTVGDAMSLMSHRYAELSVELSELLYERQAGTEVPEELIVKLWTAQRDARDYIVLGDPAVRLSTTGRQDVRS